MFGHNPFSWVPLRAESILSFKSEGDGEEWRSIPDSPDTAPAGYDDDTHEDNGWTADACEAKFFLFKGTDDQIGIAYPIDSNYNTGEWWKSVDGNGGSTSMMVSGKWFGEPYIDAYTRVLYITGNHWDSPGDTDPEIETITTIVQPAFGNAKWTWIANLADIPTNCVASQDCSYSNWSEWSPCDKDREPDHLGGVDGTQTRTRTVTSGSNCDGVFGLSQLTQTQDCISPQPCEWGAWSEWSYPEGQSWASARGICGFNNDDIGQVITRTRTRSVIKAHQGGSEEDLCPDGINETGWSSTQTETETTPCPTSASDCADGEIWQTMMERQEDGTRVEKGRCIACPQNTDPNADEDDYGCKSGCKSGFTDTDIGITMNCHKIGCTDPLAKNYDSTATLECNKENGGYDYHLGWNPNTKDSFPPNRCCEYDCDNPLLETDGQGKCKDECIDGYEMDSAGNCVEKCNEGFELIDGECKKSPKKDEKKKITTQTDISTVIEPESSNMAPIIGGIAVLGVLGFYLMQRE